jgi:hydrogenase maturation protein HypF
MEDVKRYSVIITGIVQGVGFRPFIYNLAKSLSLYGWVNNSSQGVVIEVEGRHNNLNDFIEKIKNNPPPLSNIKSISIKEEPVKKYSDFQIIASVSTEEKNVYISPDISICKDCENEFGEIDNRRFNYPFINCTNCGPRFSIVKGFPYDRKKTTMDLFPMCDKCASEYENPADRRYHAQPISCFDCGPELKLFSPQTGDGEIGLAAAQCSSKLLEKGFIVAVKGIGGFHLVCDALNETAVKKLRTRKVRDDKPFALMVKDFATALKYCYINEEEKKLLESIQKPIVLLRKRENCTLTNSISPGNPFLGIMLPYTPVHLLLFQELSTTKASLSTLVMTSANRSSEPIYYKDKEAIENLSDIADYFLLNNREIYLRTDDSVTRIFRGEEYIIRRSRGYVPSPIEVGHMVQGDGSCASYHGNGAQEPSPCTIQSVLACGGEQKNTFCMNNGQEFFISHHIGDLENMETLNSFEEGIAHFKKIFSIDFETVAYDLHPEYLSTKYAMELDMKNKIPVQHHHAHIASCMAENNLNEDVIGVAFDGTGYGEDGNLWGGEFFAGGYKNFSRQGHFDYVKMPGGEMAVKEPWRMALSYLLKVCDSSDINDMLGISSESGCKQRILPDIEMEKIVKLIEIIEKNINCPLTSSAGRLFDAVAALIGIRRMINYEGQAAVELEFLSEKKYCGEYNFKIEKNELTFIIHVDEMIKEIISDLRKSVSKEIISSKFHETLAKIVSEGCLYIKEKTGLKKVALSGGVFQNITLLEKCIDKLDGSGFEVYIHRNVPTNDGGLCLGQAVIALAKLEI